MEIKILLADDQLLILESIKTILESESAINVVGTACDGKTAIASVKELRPDILLIDIEMPQMNGILATKHICRYFPNTKVIVLTSHKNQDYIAEALLAGASGYLWKGNLIKDLKQEIYAFGKGYSGVKARLLTGRFKHPNSFGCHVLTQITKENSVTNRVKDREKIIYLKKKCKNIYKPTVNAKKQQRYLRLASQSRPTSTIKPIKPNTIKVSLVRKFKPLTTKKIKATNPKISSPPSIYNPPKFKHRKYRRRIIWFLFAIASIGLSIVIF
jgi:DNA-binding NarL/FixJ family response regulator